MDKEQQELRTFLEQQLLWSKKQILILDEIDLTLHEMREIAEYALHHELTQDEIKKLNGKLNDLIAVVHTLENRLHCIIH